MELTLVRHGESEQNRILHTSDNPEAITFKLANPNLTELGVEQAKHTGEYLATRKLTGCFVSALARAQQTSSHITKHIFAIHLYTTTNLNEKNEKVCGVRESESMEEFIERVRRFKENVLENSSYKQTLVIGHSVFFSVLTSLLLEEPVQEPLVYRNPNCAITRFRRENGKWKLVCQGSVDHLPEELRTGVDRTPSAEK